jgi:multicomponent Na+:H+ antiporter subunit G
MLATELLRSLLLLGGALLFLIGSIGLIRLPDPYTRLHALTKVDNLGLGFIVLGLLPGAGSLPVALKLLLIWLLVLAAAATSAQLLAGAAWARGERGSGTRR